MIVASFRHPVYDKVFVRILYREGKARPFSVQAGVSAGRRFAPVGGARFYGSFATALRGSTGLAFGEAGKLSLVPRQLVLPQVETVVSEL